jgi:hypothetical protein
MTTHDPAIAEFIDELYRNQELAAQAQDWGNFLAALDSEGDTNPDAAALFDALLWICCQSKPVTDRLAKIHELVNLRGYQVVSMREFCGW